MFCVDCGCQIGSRVRVNGQTLRLCEGCAEQRVNDGDVIESLDEWRERREDERADRALAERWH